MDIQHVEKHTIFLTIVGSQAYGIHGPNSDQDEVGVMIPGVRYAYGFEKFEQFRDFPTDKVIYDIRKALILMADNNPNMLDLLYVPERCILKTTPEWKIIQENRDIFLTKKCRFTFSGYAFTQLERIKTHRKFLLEPPKTEPKREDFGLPPRSVFPTAQIKAVVYSVLGDFLIEHEKQNFLQSLDEIYSTYIIPLFERSIKEDRRKIALQYLQVGVKSQSNSLKSLGPSYIKDEYLEMATKELQYLNAKGEWEQYKEWAKSRNKARAELEIEFGYDTKHAAHLVRLLNMCVEILETGKVNVDRTHIDADELKAIRAGAWSYQKIEEYARDMDKRAAELYKLCPLPEYPNINKIEELCVLACEKHLEKQL